MCWEHRNNKFCTFQDIADEIPLFNKSLTDKINVDDLIAAYEVLCVLCVPADVCLCVCVRERVRDLLNKSLTNVDDKINVGDNINFDDNISVDDLIAAYQVMCALRVCVRMCVCVRERESVCVCTSWLPFQQISQRYRVA